MTTTSPVDGREFGCPGVRCTGTMMIMFVAARVFLSGLCLSGAAACPRDLGGNGIRG
ncbi:MAG: hypothetical protein ACTH2Q_00325 [Propionibacteriaceae bacterium]